MALRLRLARGGAKKRPFYRIVVADARMPRDGRFVEKLGTLDPFKKEGPLKGAVIDLEKVRLWLSRGAQPTDRVARLLETAGILPPTSRHNPQKAQPKKKAQERAAASQAAG